MPLLQIRGPGLASPPTLHPRDGDRSAMPPKTGGSTGLGKNAWDLVVQGPQRPHKPKDPTKSGSKAPDKGDFRNHGLLDRYAPVAKAWLVLPPYNSPPLL